MSFVSFSFRNMSEKQISRTIPDSMTSWIASGFALNDEFGLGVANKKEVIIKIIFNNFTSTIRNFRNIKMKY